MNNILDYSNTNKEIKSERFFIIIFIKTLINLIFRIKIKLNTKHKLT